LATSRNGARSTSLASAARADRSSEEEGVVIVAALPLPLPLAAPLPPLASSTFLISETRRAARG
jgi:hypothetical protein